MQLLDKKYRKQWGGHSVHPFIEYLDKHLKAEGYEFEGFDDVTEGCGWSIALFSGYYARFFIWPEPPTLGKNYFGFKASIDIKSSRQRDIHNQLKIWECENLRWGNRLDIALKPITIMHVMLNWLMARWEPKLESFVEALGRWGNVKSSDWQICVDDVLYFLHRQGRDFLAHVGTPVKLAYALQNPLAFPGYHPKSGPLSSAPGEFAAVLLHDSGYSKEAINELELDVRVLEAKVNRGERDKIVLDLKVCKERRYRGWILQNPCARFVST